MIRNLLYKKIIIAACLLMAFGSLILVSSFSFNDNSPTKTGVLKISFINSVNGKPVVLRDSLYSNYFNEQYSISKLKYYISNIVLSAAGKGNNMGGYYLMNAASDENSFELTLSPGNYNSIQFLLGVDSIRNCSGAQTDALDPMNDMFWTWNSGYVMFKLEGTSAASTADLNRIEHHVGGYKGTNNVATTISLDLKNSIEIKPGSSTELVIEMNLDNYWHGNADIKIAETALCMAPGDLSKKLASNFKNLFSIKSIHNNP